MPTFRTRATYVIPFAIAALSGCGADTPSPLEPAAPPSISTTTDTTKRTTPTLPWTDVKGRRAPDPSGN